MFCPTVCYLTCMFVGVSTVTLLVYLINVPDLHVVSIAKLYIINNLKFNKGESYLVL